MDIVCRPPSIGIGYEGEGDSKGFERFEYPLYTVRPRARVLTTYPFNHTLNRTMSKA